MSILRLYKTNSLVFIFKTWLLLVLVIFTHYKMPCFGPFSILFCFGRKWICVEDLIILLVILLKDGICTLIIWIFMDKGFLSFPTFTYLLNSCYSCKFMDILLYHSRYDNLFIIQITGDLASTCAFTSPTEMTSLWKL